jgi:hypothetical protein
LGSQFLAVFLLKFTGKYHVPDVAKIERGKKLGREQKQIG